MNDEEFPFLLQVYSNFCKHITFDNESFKCHLAVNIPLLNQWQVKHLMFI